MKTLTVKTAQKNFRKSYAEREYGVTADQLDRAVKQVNKEIDANRKAGRVKPFTGKLKGT